MRISINLATRPYADQGPMVKRLRIGMAVLAGLLLILGLGLLHFHQSALRVAAREEAMDKAIANIQREEDGYQAQMQQPLNAKVLTQAGFLNHLFDVKSFSWTAAMEDLERVLPAGVQVTAIEPVRAKNGQLTLRLRIAGLRERSVEMIRNMEHSQRFVHPRITGENSDNSESQSGPGSRSGPQTVHDSGRVAFEVLAEYNPPTLEQRKAANAAQKRAVPSVEIPPLGAPARPGFGPGAGMGARPGFGPGAGPGARPGYLPPNLQQQQQRQFQRPMPNRTPNPGVSQQNPNGFDPNGLRNHSQNRLRPDGAPTEATAGEPQ
ncbi:fimbrial assembly protein [Acidicapsa ligni]|uniref:fimbrial assembly protein n=1 Tax=Acidicapsa ligni TaxID=542300 RepID=UPI0021DFEB15|nr:fimbrial assembly protein [Acidicapsa ligni]